MTNKLKIIIYGGTFDPPHRGHFALIKAALEALNPGALYIVPSLRSPFKKEPCAPFSDRAAMLRAGLKSAGLGRDTRVKVHPYEADRGRVTYTWQTISFFRKKHPGAEIYFLMGSDSLESFRLWSKYRRILASARLVVGARSGFAQKNPRGLPYIKLKGRFPHIDSTGLRAGLFSGQPGQDIVTSVLSYIERRGLYFAGLRVSAAKLMTPARYAHTISVTKLALSLAAEYGADPSLTAAAGLLHDIARDRSQRYLAAYALKHGLTAPAFKDTLGSAPVLLHASAGAYIAEKKFGVKDRDALNAIRNHTLGSSRPGLIEKIIYVADLAAGGRNFPEAEIIRRLAFKNLDAAYAAANYVKLICAFRSGGWVHPESVKVWNSLSEKNK